MWSVADIVVIQQHNFYNVMMTVLNELQYWAIIKSCCNSPNPGLKYTDP